MGELVYDIMLLVSCGVMTLGIVGILRMPDIYTKLHGASKSVFLGLIVLCLSATVISSTTAIFRLVLIIVLVFISTPIASHVLGRAAYKQHERMETPGAIDESHTLLDEEGKPLNEPTWRL